MPPTLTNISLIKNAQKNIKDVVVKSSVELNEYYSSKFQSNIYFKREDLQKVKSFKIRGAYNKISLLSKNNLNKGIVCASAGNHAQGFAYACKKLNIHGTIFMPIPTPQQKVDQVKKFGSNKVEIILIGEKYDDAHNSALSFSKNNNMTYIHPFDDIDVINGQATLFLEILEQIKNNIDYLFVPIGGGGLISGAITVFKQLSPKTKIIGVETVGAPSMFISLKNKKNTTLKSIDIFVDGAAVKKVGEISYKLCDKYLDDIILVSEEEICHTLIELHKKNIKVEPAGAMSVSGLRQYKHELIAKNVVCIICGANNDKKRMPEILIRANRWIG